MEDYISRKEHEEFCKRMEDEDKRQNRRIDLLEENVLEIGRLTAEVAKLSINMEGMLKKQEQHEKRIETIEGRDGEKWRAVTGCIITTIVGIVIGYIFTKIGM